MLYSTLTFLCLVLISVNAGRIGKATDMDCPLRQLAFQYGTSILGDRGSLNLANALDLNSSSSSLRAANGYIVCNGTNSVAKG